MWLLKERPGGSHAEAGHRAGVHPACESGLTGQVGGTKSPYCHEGGEGGDSMDTADAEREPERD